MTGARIFVAVVFAVLGLTFPVVTAVLYNEFGDAWLPLAAFYSNLFLFYPIFGILALVAFYIPAVMFTDFYWNHVQPQGRVRFVVGTVVVVALSVLISESWKRADNWGTWTFAPTVVGAERWEPPNCSEREPSTCRRAPLLKLTRSVWTEGQKRWGMSKLVRDCHPDPLLELPEENLKGRYCFASGTMLNAEQCCRAQSRLIEAVKGLKDAPRSATFEWHHMLLPFKVFFLLVLFVIGLLLAFWNKRLHEVYSERQIASLERGLLIGAFAMLFWPLMDYACLQSSQVLYGRWSQGFTAMASLLVGVLVGPWALLLLFFFLSRVSARRRLISRTAGTAVGAIAVVKFEELTNFAASFTGSGVGWSGIVGLVALSAAALLAMALLARREGRRLASGP